MKRIALIVAAILALLPMTPAHSGTPSTVSYQPDDSVIANPSRGFYHVADTHYRDATGAGWVPMDVATLRSWRAEGITQVLREVFLEEYGGAGGAWNLSPDLLRKVDADFATARKAGVGVILRFAYTLPPDGVWPPPTPYGDAPVARTLHHIHQLTPVLRKNSDVIETVQEGFIGLWGEGYYSDYFSDPKDPSVVTDANWADRAKVLHALLNALPKSVTVQVRTMYMKQRILGVPTGSAGALTASQAFSGSDLSRVGHHNDCFLASADDYGTFLSDPLSLDEHYLAADSRYVPVGGETCATNPPKSLWPSARSQMERFHYSYLNTEYNQDVLDSWGGDGYTEAAKRLGYRFTLVRGEFTSDAHIHGRLRVDLQIRNSGFSAPYQKRPAQLVLTDGRHTYRLRLPTDPRRWSAGTTTDVRAAIPLPPRVRPGVYRLALALPSAAPALADRADYAIRTANAGTWDAVHGWNDLAASVRISS
ncbi:MAG TPA: DUF4832 domain-containing protein [Mycobacteriales bacterium]|nr:DUF4832 domain-containing protein [Mycobacteriales bacterium]